MGRDKVPKQEKFGFYRSHHVAFAVGSFLGGTASLIEAAFTYSKEIHGQPYNLLTLSASGAATVMFYSHCAIEAVITGRNNTINSDGKCVARIESSYVPRGKSREQQCLQQCPTLRQAIAAAGIEHSKVSNPETLPSLQRKAIDEGNIDTVLRLDDACKLLATCAFGPMIDPIRVYDGKSTVDGNTGNVCTNIKFSD